MTRSLLAAVLALALASPTLAQDPVNLVPSDRDLAGASVGIAIAADSQRVAIGAPGEKSQQGAVYIFDRTDQGWVQTARVVTDDSLSTEQFGKTVALDGNHLVVSAQSEPMPPTSNRSGLVYRFEFVAGRSGSGWNQEQKVVIPGGASVGGTFFSGSAGAIDLIGGTRMAFQATQGTTQRVDVYEPTSTSPLASWARTATIASPSANIGFGSDLALDGDRIVIGAQRDQTNGAAYVYRLATDQTWTLTSTLRASGAEAPSGRLAGGTRSGSSPSFGASVALDGDRAVVGAPFHYDAGTNRLTGAAYVFDATTSGTQETWALVTQLAPDDLPTSNAQFGTSVALDSNRVVVGAPFDNGSTSPVDARTGAAHVFDGTASGWTQAAKLAFPSGRVGEFGAGVVMVGDRPVVAAKNDLSAFVFTIGDPVASDRDPAPSLALSAPAPNPASGRTALTLTVDAPQHVRVALHDALGRTVRQLVEGPASGSVELAIDTAGLAPGVYVVRAVGETFARTQTLTVAR